MWSSWQLQVHCQPLCGAIIGVIIRSLSWTGVSTLATFLMMFGACMNILFITKVKICVLGKWSLQVSQLCWLLSLKWLSYCKHVVQFLRRRHVASSRNVTLWGGHVASEGRVRVRVGCLPRSFRGVLRCVSQHMSIWHPFLKSCLITFHSKIIGVFLR
jgi:hypothetical protein